MPLCVANIIIGRSAPGPGMNLRTAAPRRSGTSTARACTDFKVHYAILPANKWGLENLANLAKLPERGATVFVGLPKVKGASGGPTRVIAVW